MALHYHLVMRIFHRVPVTVAVGGSNTGKTLMAKVASSMFGFHRECIYGKVL